ncbi:MAG: hypothetical protein WBQ26_01785 [Gemmatimonadaceae bacterium]|nr:hypothetical protein [Gemmatimonadaceae bacterium]
MTRFARAVAMAAAAAVLAACGGESRPLLHLPSKSYDFVIEPSDIPPHARESITYKVIVRDRQTQQPIENGEGQIFANTRDGASTWDGFTNGPELGTYYGKLNFVIAGQWAMAIRFRRDSLHPLERVDWMQDVFNERPDSTP